MDRSLTSIVLGCALASPGCSNHDDPRLEADAALEVDAAVVDTPLIPDCSSAESSDVSLKGKTFHYAALGNLDTGGEGSCGPPGDTAVIEIAVQPTFSDVAQTLWFRLPFPASIGVQSVTVSPPGSQTNMSVMVNITKVTLAGTGPDLELVEGSFQGPMLTGAFSAPHCALLDFYCI
jgi:hypothetical protein